MYDHRPAAACLSKHGDLEVSASFVSRFKPGQLGHAFIDLRYHIDRIQQRIDLVVIHKRKIIGWSLTTFTQHDHDSFGAADSASHIAHMNRINAKTGHFNGGDAGEAFDYD